MIICVVECCGINAFDRSPVQIGKRIGENSEESSLYSATQAEEPFAKVFDANLRYLSKLLNHLASDAQARKRLLDFFCDFALVLGEAGKS